MKSCILNSFSSKNRIAVKGLIVNNYFMIFSINVDSKVLRNGSIKSMIGFWNFLENKFLLRLVDGLSESRNSDVMTVFPNSSMFFVYSKSEYTLKSVSVSGRLHDNSSKGHPMVIKFLPIEWAHQYLGRVRR